MGARLPAKDDHNCRLAIGEANVARVFNRVFDMCQSLSRTAASSPVGDHERLIVLGMVRLVVGIDL
jgi:hypothetical protein